jgi:hypothetical protein
MPIDWDKTKPLGTQPGSDMDDAIRDTRAGVEMLLGTEHTVDVSNPAAVTAKHAVGSARAGYDTEANKPTTGTGVETGRIFVASDTKRLKVGTGSEVVDIDAKTVGNFDPANSAGFFHFAGDAPFSGTPFSRNQTQLSPDWYTVGPAGSGADIVWTALDSVPVGAKGVMVNVRLYCIGNTAVYGMVRKAGSTTEGGSLGIVAGNEQIYHTLPIPLDASRRFELYWYKVSPLDFDPSTATFTGYLQGWYI